jgi:hypothetical protein
MIDSSINLNQRPCLIDRDHVHRVIGQTHVVSIKLIDMHIVFQLIRWVPSRTKCFRMHWQIARRDLPSVLLGAAYLKRNLSWFHSGSGPAYRAQSRRPHAGRSARGLRLSPSCLTASATLTCSSSTDFPLPRASDLRKKRQLPEPA